MHALQWSVSNTKSLTNIFFTQKSIVEELLHEDGLTIMANGLTWQKISAVLLRVQIERRRDPAQRGVLLVLGCRDWQRSTLKDELARLDPQLLPRSFAIMLLRTKSGRHFYRAVYCPRRATQAICLTYWCWNTGMTAMWRRLHSLPQRPLVWDLSLQCRWM